MLVLLIRKTTKNISFLFSVMEWFVKETYYMQAIIITFEV